MTRLTLALLFLLGSVSLFAQEKHVSADTEVRDALTKFVYAFDNLDWESFRLAFDDDATVFYPRAFPERANGRAEFEKTFKMFFHQIRSGKTTAPYMDIQPKDMNIQVFGDTAVATFHLDDRAGFLNRRTFVLNKTKAGWKIVHLHASEVSAVSAGLSGSNQETTARTSSENNGSSAKDQLVGTWRLISRVVTSENGTPVQDVGLGKVPKGYLIYDPTGHMAVEIMKADRATAVDCGTSPAPSDNSQTINGYDAYFGTYTIDERNGTVTHKLEGALAVSDVGKNLVRHFKVSGDRLTIVVRTNTTPERQIRTLTWERVR